MKTKLLCGLLISSFALFGENLFFNGKLGLETEGFALEKWLTPSVNPKLEYFPLEACENQGKKALKIDNRHAEFYWLFSKEFKLKPKTAYTFRFNCRSDEAEERFMYGLYRVDPKWFAHQSKFSAGKEWKPIVFSFTTDEKGGYFHLRLRPASKNKIVPCTLYLTDFKLSEKEPASEKPAVEAAILRSRKVYFRGETADFELLTSNPGDLAYSGSLTVTAKDDYFGTVVFTETVDVSLAPGESKRIRLTPRKMDRYSRFTITITGPGSNALPLPVAVIGKYEAKPFDILQDYVVALNGGMNYFGKPEVPCLSYRVRNSSFEEFFELLSAMGARLLRDHDAGIRGVDWRWLEQQPGKWEFSHLQRQLETYRKYHFIYFPVMAAIGFVSQEYRPSSSVLGWPAWVSELSKKQYPAPPTCMPKLKNHIKLPPEEQFREYLTQVIRRTKNDVPVYEFVNEPNLYLSPENYFRYLKIFHEVMRKEAPKSKICGFCLSSDFGVNGASWRDRLIQLGGLDYVDCFSFHPYGGRELGSFNAADENITNLRRTLKEKSSSEKPLWNTELYYLINQKVKNPVDEENSRAHHVVWRFLVDLGEDVVQSISLPASYLFVEKRLMPHSMHWRNGREELLPGERFVAYNTMARLFECSKRVGKFRYDTGVICYVYRDKNKKLIAAIWNYLGKTGLRADFSEFQVMDMFGNEEVPGVKELKDAPYYLTPGKMSDDEFMEKIKNLKPALDNPVSVGEFGRLAGDKLFVVLYNISEKPVSVTLGLNGKGLIAQEMVELEIPAKGKIPVEIPVKIKDPGVKESILVVRLNGNISRKKIKIVRNSMISGTFEGKNFKGDLKFGNGEIRVRLTVQDATDAGPTGKRNVWKTDCVELFFDTDPLFIPERYAQTYNQNTFRVFITPRDGKISASKGVDLTKCRHSVKCGKDSYTVDFSIPAKVGNYLGFECKIDDCDAAGKCVSETQVGGGKRLHVDRCSFVLAKEK